VQTRLERDRNEKGSLMKTLTALLMMATALAFPPPVRAAEDDLAALARGYIAALQANNQENVPMP
jgi:hypothetical protein